MNTSQNALQEASHNKDEKRPRALKHISVDRARGKDVEARGGLQFRFNDYQHAQVTRAIFEQEQTGTAILDLDGRIERANRALARLLGYRQEELAGKVLEELARDVKQSRNLGTSAQTSHRMPILVNCLTHKSGDMIECLVDSHVIYDASGKATSFLVFVSDARSGNDTEERNRFERELYRTQALQTLGTLAGGVAHDFNNALEVIIGFASLARIRLTRANPMNEPLKIIEESARNAAGLARQLLDVSRTNEADKSTIDVGVLIGAVLTIITRTFDRKIRIEHRVAPNVPHIKGFRNRLEHAILNLCINARDAMPQGGTLTIESTSYTFKRNDHRIPGSNKSGTYVRIVVRDSGTGMKAEIMEKIFVPLFTTKKRGHGSGLGLAMVDRVVKEAGGFVSVNSMPGEGSEFALYLPAVFTKRESTTKAGPVQLVSGRGTVLVVDDEPRVLEFLEKGLTRLGYTVVRAQNGNEACEIYAAKSREIDCVLLDMIMPGMSGPDTCTRLRDINPSIKVILSSGYSSGRMKCEAMQNGSVEFLEKPYTLEALSQALGKIQQN